MRFLQVSIFIISFFITACEVKPGQGTIDLDFEKYFDNIAQIDNCLGEGEIFQDLSRRMDEGIKAPLDTLNSVATFKALYYEAHKRQIEAGPRKDGRCVDTNYAVKDRSLEKLAIINNEAAMDAIIEIYKDTKLTFPGNEAKSLVRYMSQFGEPLLSKLEAVKDLRPLIGPKVITNIKN